MTNLRKILEELWNLGFLGKDMNKSIKETCENNVNEAHQQILALKPKRKETHWNCEVEVKAGEKPYCKTCRKEVVLSNEWYADYKFNQAISEMEHSMTGER
jgi:hypothetical protein